MEDNEINLNNPIVQLEIMKERLRNAEEKNSQQEESLRQANVTIGRLEERLRQATEDSHNMKVTLEVTKQKLTHAEQTLQQSNQNTTGKVRKAKWTTFFLNILLIGASIPIGIGASYVASTSPNSIGWVFIILGGIVDIVAAALTALLT